MAKKKTSTKVKEALGIEDKAEAKTKSANKTAKASSGGKCCVVRHYPNGNKEIVSEHKNQDAAQEEVEKLVKEANGALNLNDFEIE